MTLGPEELRHLRVNVAELRVHELAAEASVPASAILAAEAGTLVLDPERESRIYAAIDARVRVLSGEEP